MQATKKRPAVKKEIQIQLTFNERTGVGLISRIFRSTQTKLLRKQWEVDA